MSERREPQYCAPSPSKVFSQVKRASLEALQLGEPSSNRLLRRWSESLRDLGLPKPDRDRLAVRDVASLSKNLQAMDFRSFSRELLSLGKSLARQEIALDNGLALIESLSEDYLSALREKRHGERESLEGQLRRTELALAIGRLCILAARILATGYSKQLDEERRSRNSRSREADEILRRTSSMLTHVYERERSKISRCLQEKLGHYLVGLKLHIDNLTQAYTEGSTEQFSAELEGAAAIVDEAIRSVRRMVLDLGPAVVREVGLIPAVRMYVRQFSSRFWIDVTIEVEDLPTEIPIVVQVALYRLSQQVLDFCRQSQAKNIRMSFKGKKGSIAIVVELDKVSADVPRKSADESWVILLNRAQLLGAVLVRKSGDVWSRIEILVPPRRVSTREGQDAAKTLFFHVASANRIH
jgi:signal transduction histidine kinase